MGISCRRRSKDNSTIGTNNGQSPGCIYIFKIRKLQFCRVLGGGFDCTHCKVELHSLQINFTSAQLQLLGGGGGSTALTADQLHFSQTSTPGWGGLTSVTAKLNCTHCRSTSLQPNFNSWVGGVGFDCSHCKVELHSLQINFTSAQLPTPGWGGGGVQLQSLQS